MNKQERIRLLEEWMQFYREAKQYGADELHAEQIANALTGLDSLEGGR